MPRALASIAVAASAAVLVASLLACGGGESAPDPPSEPPAQLLAEALAHPAPSGVATVQLNLSLEGSSPLAGASSVSLHGPFELDPAGGPPSFDLALDAQVAGFGVDGAVVSTGDDAYVVFFGENYRVGPERVAALARELEANASAGGLGLRVDRWFEDPHYAGLDDVAGTETERIEGTLDTAALARDLAVVGDVLGARGLADAVAVGGRSGPASAWVAYEDTTIRRINAQFPFTVPPAERAAAKGITGGAVSLDAQISNVGEKQLIEPPEGGGFQPIENLTDRIGSLAGLAF